MSIDFCPFEEAFDAAYTEITVSVIFFIILQILLLCHTLCYEYKSYKRKGKVIKAKVSIRTTFVLLQLLGFYFTMIDLFRFVMDPYLQFLQSNTFSCSLVAYSPKIVTIIYFAVYLCQVLLRLELSFRGSHLALSRNTVIILAIAISIPSAFVTITYFIFVDKPCIWQWKPIDISVHDDFAFCDFHTEGIANTVIGLGIFWIVIVNIVYGIIFGVKLKNVLRSAEADKKTSFKLKSLIIKNTVLTTIGSISTLVNWFIWLSLAGSILKGISFLYFDMWFNCVMISLMFKYNEVYYKRLCKPCIVCCLMDCDKTYNKLNKSEHAKQLKRTKKYLRHQSQASDIFTSRTDLSSIDVTTDNANIEVLSQSNMDHDITTQSPMKTMELQINVAQDTRENEEINASEFNEPIGSFPVTPVGSISAEPSIPDTY